MFEFYDDTETKKRSKAISEFIDKMLDEDEHPFVLTDKATLLDICSDDEETLISKCYKLYGIMLEKRHLQIPIWQLIDLIEA